MQRFKPDFIALVTYFLPESGGRNWPVHSGYQPIFQFEGIAEYAHAENIFTDREYLQLGETAAAEITIVGSQQFDHLLFEGKRFNIFEPPRHIGSGIIKKILNKDLETTNVNVIREMIA
jgi:translation elongation factor EF-Tu-like GTPase